MNMTVKDSMATFFIVKLLRIDEKHQSFAPSWNSLICIYCLLNK